MVSPGLDPGFHESEGGIGTTALIQLNDIVDLPYIKISYFFTNVLMTRITSLHWIRTRTPALGIQGDIHYTTDAEGDYISLNIYFWTSQKARRNLPSSQVQTPLCPLLQTPSRAQNCSAELPPPLGCGKSANLQTANCILRPIYICTGVADWSVIFIVVIGDHCFPCGVTFLRMHQDTYNYYAFAHRILSYLVFHYKTPPAPLTSSLRLCRPRS